MARGHATYEDLLRAPDRFIAELMDGELFTSPRPMPIQAVFASQLAMEIGHPYDLGRGGPGGWLLLYQPEVHLDIDRLVLVPDLAGWRLERMAAVPRDHRFLVPPDWVCEVLSPSTYRLDRHRKLPTYADYGVRHAWIADPVERFVEIYRLENEHWVLLNTYGGEDTFRAEPFEEVEIDLASIWGPDSPPAP